MNSEVRERIVTTLYYEVIRATQALNEGRSKDPKVRHAAQDALQNAVRRYTDFTADGHIPDDLEMASASGG
jgi:hypothetical protein